MRIQWDPSMTTGVAQIDEQHKKLLQTLNFLLDEMSRGQGQQEIEAVLNWLADYAAKHFAFEETCMIQHRCPFAMQNKSAHEEFIRMFTGFRDQFRQKGASASLILQVEQQLARWVQDHIKRVDTKLASCVAKAA